MMRNVIKEGRKNDKSWNDLPFSINAEVIANLQNQKLKRLFVLFA